MQRDFPFYETIQLVYIAIGQCFNLLRDGTSKKAGKLETVRRQSRTNGTTTLKTTGSS